MGTWAENSRRYKHERAQDPVERARDRVRKPSQVTPTRKHLLDRLEQARKDFIRQIEWREEFGRRSWWVRDISYWEKKYESALKKCMAAGIDVKA